MPPGQTTDLQLYSDRKPGEPTYLTVLRHPATLSTRGPPGSLLENQIRRRTWKWIIPTQKTEQINCRAGSNMDPTRQEEEIYHHLEQMHRAGDEGERAGPRPKGLGLTHALQFVSNSFI